MELSNLVRNVTVVDRAAAALTRAATPRPANSPPGHNAIPAMKIAARRNASLLRLVKYVARQRVYVIRKRSAVVQMPLAQLTRPHQMVRISNPTNFYQG
jgi:hypothetical protein